MRRLPECITIVCIVALAIAASAARADEAAQPSGSDASAPIHALFERYKEVARADEGETVAALVSGASVEHYERLRRAALSATPGAPETALPRLVDRMQAQMLAKLLGPEKLAAMDGRRVVAYAFETGMLGEDLERTSGLDRIEVKEGAATARHIARGRPLNAPYREVTLGFVREQGEWRLDLLHTLDVMEAQMGDLARETGIEEDVLAKNIVAAFTGESLEKGAEEFARAVAAQAPPKTGGVAPAPRGPAR